MAKKYKVELADETVALIESKGYSVEDYIRLLLNDVVNDTTKKKAKDILEDEHTEELTEFDEKIKKETKVKEE